MKKHSFLALMAWFYDVASIMMAPAIITTSEYNYNIAKRFNKNTYLVRIGFPPPKLDRFKVGKFEPGRKTVLSLTLWDKGRRPSFYVELANRLPEYDFVLAGSWTIEDEMHLFIEENRNVKNLRITGRIDDSEKIRLLTNSHFYIRFGYNERGPGMGALEAMSYGLIPFANQGIGLSELITDRVNGFLITESLLEETVSAFKYVLTLSQDVLEEMSLRNLELCNTYSWENNAQGLMEVFEKYDI